MSSVIQEIWDINVLFAITERFLVFLLNGSQMHVVSYLIDLTHTNSIKSFILCDFVEWRLFVRTYWDYSARLINLVNCVAKSIKFSNRLTVKMLLIKWSCLKSDYIGASVTLHNNLWVLTEKEGLDLFENISEIVSWGWQFTKLIALVWTPEETSLGETGVPYEVCSYSDVVIAFSS